MKTRLNVCWCAIKQRCLNPNNPSYRYYGGRGIGICDEWMEYTPFCEWALANGYKEDLTIERIENDGNYEPSNCTWIKKGEQTRNTRQNRIIAFMGRRQLLTQWAKECGIKPTTLHYRLKAGWLIEKALTKKPIYNTSATFHGKTQTISQWAKELNINPTTLYMRANRYNWSISRALSAPIKGGAS